MSSFLSRFAVSRAGQYLNKRPFSSDASHGGHGQAEKHATEEASHGGGGILHNPVIWEKLTYVGSAITGLFALYVLIYDKHTHRTPIEYPHMAIREKPFPWADGNVSCFNQLRADNGGRSEHH